MCGRFTLTTQYDDICSYVQASIFPAFRGQYRPRYNVAPTSSHWVVQAHLARSREIVAASWGLRSPFGPPSRDPVGHINARCETAASKPSFRDAFVDGRCGVLADGFFEWSGTGRTRQPHWFHRPNRAPLVFAGLVRSEEDPQTGEVQRRFTILTSPANQTLAPFHQRMPVILDREDLAAWLEPPQGRGSHELLDRVGPLLRPAPDDLLVARKVSTRVNVARHDDPACLLPPTPPAQASLFE